MYLFIFNISVGLIITSLLSCCYLFPFFDLAKTLNQTMSSNMYFIHLLPISHISRDNSRSSFKKQPSIQFTVSLFTQLQRSHKMSVTSCLFTFFCCYLLNFEIIIYFKNNIMCFLPDILFLNVFDFFSFC